MLAHVDVNSAYVSWERVFQPRLEGRAVAVACVLLDVVHSAGRTNAATRRAA